MNGLPIVDILKLGLSGFCFLLAFLGYLLLRREQSQAKPRQNILSAIRFFLGFAFVLGVLVGFLPLFIRSDSNQIPRPDADYLIDATFHTIDMGGFAEVSKNEFDTPKSIVFTDRTDLIRKNTDKDIHFSLPMYTTGLRMEHRALMNSVLTSFSLVESSDGDNKKTYEFSLPIGKKQIDHSEVIRNRFEFVNGFRDGKTEWWIASVKYPTSALGVYLLFPENKRCREVNAYRQRGISPKQLIQDNPPKMAEDGKYVYWIGVDEKPDSRIHFEWKW